MKEYEDEAPAPPDPPAPKPSDELESEDFLKTQVLHLRLQVLGLEQEKLQKLQAEIQQKIIVLQGELLENRRYLEDKYKVDLTQMQIGQDGKLFPRS